MKGSLCRQLDHKKKNSSCITYVMLSSNEAFFISRLQEQLRIYILDSSSMHDIVRSAFYVARTFAKRCKLYYT